MSPELNLPEARSHAAVLGAWARALVGAGFEERSVCAWYGAPLVSDTHHVAAPLESRRPRRGLGAHIALWVAGEEIERRAASGLGDEMVAALVASGLLEEEEGRLRARVSLTPFLGALVLADRLDERGRQAVRPPDLSAWNVAASLPPGALRLVDAGCGAGAILLAAARRGGEAAGFDIDARALEFAELNLVINQVPAGRVQLALADVREPPPGCYTPGATCVFNAPLVRAELAGDAPLYLHAPGGEALPLAFLVSATSALPGGEVLCHAQLTAPIWEAATQSPFSAVIALEFAHAPDGTPHALLALRSDVALQHRRRFRVPLGSALPHLRREAVDRLQLAAALAGRDPSSSSMWRSTALRPAPWLQLVRSEQHDGHAFRARELRFGGALLDEEEAALLARCDGRPAAEVARDDDEWARLGSFLGRGLLVP